MTASMSRLLLAPAEPDSWPTSYCPCGAKLDSVILGIVLGDGTPHSTHGIQDPCWLLDHLAVDRRAVRAQLRAFYSVYEEVSDRKTEAIGPLSMDELFALADMLVMRDVMVPDGAL